jgi:pSer/pThr/pTyr-binding forkhead associated (FHA) protein
VHRDLDDTVITPRRPLAPAAEPDEADTVLSAPGTTFAPSDLEPSTPRPGRRFGFRVGGAEPIPLDVPGIVGRRPRAPRVPVAQPPRLVTVPSANGEISASHLEVRQVGETVVVTDLRSTNGTIVRMPGSAPLVLRQGGSAVVLPGSTVELGDGVVVELVRLDRLAAQGTGDD